MLHRDFKPANSPSRRSTATTKIMNSSDIACQSRAAVTTSRQLTAEFEERHSRKRSLMGDAAAAIALAPIAEAAPTAAQPSAQQIAPVPQRCTTTNAGSECVSPGNAQFDGAPSVVDNYPMLARSRGFCGHRHIADRGVVEQAKAPRGRWRLVARASGLEPYLAICDAGPLNRLSVTQRTVVSGGR